MPVMVRFRSNERLGCRNQRRENVPQARFPSRGNSSNVTSQASRVAGVDEVDVTSSTGYLSLRRLSLPLVKRDNSSEEQAE